MAITEDKGEPNGDGLNLPRSTGAVKYEPPKDPEPITGDPGESTGAVKYESPTVGNITNPNVYDPADAEVRVEYPKEPVTMTTGWLSESQAKVVTKQQQEAARQSVQEPKKSAAAETPEDGVDVERKAAAGDDEPPAGIPAEADEPAKQAEAEDDGDDDEFVPEDHPGGDDLPAGEALPPDEVSKKDSGRRRAPKAKDK